MLITSATQYADATDPAYIAETTTLLTGLTKCELAVTVAWLARMAGQAIIDKHNGSHEMAMVELQQLGVAIVEAQAEAMDRGRVGD